MTRRLALTVTLGAAFVSCQLATVPKDACFQGEACAHSGGGAGGGGAGGGSADGGSEPDAGFDAGPEVPDLFKDAGICEDWACVAGKLPAPGVVAPTFTRVDIPVDAPPPSSSCGPNWSGGVLLPDGRVLAIPSCADHFLLIDVAAQHANLVGPPLNTTGAPLFLSGVLGCDGRVYAMPAFGSQLARVSVTPGTTHIDVVFFDVGLAPAMHGAVVAQSCERGLVIAGIGQNTPVDDYALAERVHVRENGVELTTFQIMRADRVTGGAFRLGDDSVWLGAAANLAGKHAFTRFDPSDGGVALLWATNPVTGFDIFPSGEAVTGAGGAVFVEEAGDAYALVPDAGAPLGFSVAQWVTTDSNNRPIRWPVARGDGFIYTSGASVIAISDRDGGRDVLFDQLFDAGSFVDAMEGMVVTFDGSLVGIPGSDSTVRLFVAQGGGGPTPPPEVLLSPFFNKL